MVVLLLHESPEETTTEGQSTPSKKTAKTKSPGVNEDGATAPVETALPVDAGTTPAEAAAETVTENIAEKPVNETPAETTVEAKVSSSEITLDLPEELPTVDSTSTTTTTTEASAADETTTTPMETTSTEEITLDLESPADNTTGSEVSKDTVDGTTAEQPTDDNLTEKILSDLEQQTKKNEVKRDKKDYVAPPDYEYIGRGLVYNCTGKHWACVDAPSYRICEENSASNKHLKKPVECYPFNVYQSQKGCESMQNRMVSSSAKTSFCSEN